MSETAPQNAWTKSGCLAAGITALFFASIADYFGGNLLWPLFGAIVSGVIAARFINQSYRPMVPGIAVQGGLLFWLVSGIVLVASQGSATDVPTDQRALYPYGQILDAGVQFALILWVAFRPVLRSVAVASAYAALNLLVNVYKLQSSVVPSDLYKALVMHLILEIGIIGLLFGGFFKIWRR